MSINETSRLELSCDSDLLNSNNNSNNFIINSSSNSNINSNNFSSTIEIRVTLSTSRKGAPRLST